MPRPRPIPWPVSAQIGGHFVRQNIRIAQLALLLSMALLLLVLGIFQFTRPQGVAPIIWLAQSIPLLILLPGIYNLSRRSFQWLGFVILLYFIRGVTGVLAPSVQWIDICLLFLSVDIFIISVIASRWLVPHHPSSP